MSYQDPNAGYPYGGYQQPPQQYGQQPAYGAAGQGYPPYGQQPPLPQQQQQVQYAPAAANQPPPTQQPSIGGLSIDACLQPLVSHTSQTRIKIEKIQSLQKREVFLHRNFDIDTMDEIGHMQDMKYGWQFKWESVLAGWVLFNSVSTIMIILTNFARAVDPETKAEYGNSNFDILINFITYFPLVYFFVVVLLINNYYSEITFYAFLKRGCIIDFPPSAGFKLLFTNVVPLIFIILTVAYLGVVIGCFIKFKASIGVILIFCNNLFVGIGMSWYRQQSIESKFVSISNFIQAFPDRDDSFGNMDEQSLTSASRFIENMTLTECELPSYSSYMRQYHWKHERVSALGKCFHHIFVFLTIAVMAGLCVAYFVILRGLDVKTTWNDSLNPCVQVCVGTLQSHNALMPMDCAACVCSCMASMSQKDTSVYSGCKDYGSASVCSAKMFPLCPPSYGYCNFTNTN